MPSGIPFESLNCRLEGSYLILFLLPFGVSIVTTTHLEVSDPLLFASVPSWRFTFISLLAAAQATSAAVASHTASVGRNIDCRGERFCLRFDTRRYLVLMFWVMTRALWYLLSAVFLRSANNPQLSL